MMNVALGVGRACGQLHESGVPVVVVLPRARVFDDDWLAETLRQRWTDKTCSNVGRETGSASSRAQPGRGLGRWDDRDPFARAGRERTARRSCHGEGECVRLLDGHAVAAGVQVRVPGVVSAVVPPTALPLSVTVTEVE